ncbi:HD-GYP domain-containing protein [Anaeroselena agilis]|uniref:HD-GYP domain-containing protein n=1 Tax=Anaeroselena agilis TaxID=3063788 RepID=A0ABU3P3K4_9FIRM|nr:HD-GYP domain-containing protein [Selenomonadales bacterium 4137-cl]
MATILLPTNALKPGMTVAESVCSDRQVILQENTILTSNIIRRLASWHVRSVRVNQEPSYGDGAQTIAHLSAEFVKDNPAFFTQYAKAIASAGKLFHLMRENQAVPFQELGRLATVDLYNLLRSKSLLGNLYRLKSYTDYTFMHAVDVGLLAGLLAIWNGLPEEEVKTLILCGLMHDIGKSQIPLSILDKPGKLTPEERKTIILHPEYGYYMTKSIPGILPDVQYAVWHHHERESGEGYPGRLRGDRIHPYAKIIAIADTYDALTTDKAYQKSVTPFQALETLQDLMFVHLERKLCQTFIRNILYSLMGSTVLLSDGAQAEVLQTAHYMSCKPVVATNNGVIADLHLSNRTTIVEVLKFRQ